MRSRSPRLTVVNPRRPDLLATDCHSGWGDAPAEGVDAALMASIPSPSAMWGGCSRVFVPSARSGR